METTKRYMLLVFSAIFLAGLFILDLTSPDRGFSDTENRVLKRRPKPAIQSLLNNSYMESYETYVNDQFFGRDQWITIKAGCETLLGKIENNGVMLGSDGYLFEKLTQADQGQITKNIGYINGFAASCQGRVTTCIIPGGYDILSKKLPSTYRGLDQQPVIAEIRARLGTGFLDLYPALSAAADAQQYIFYRTDHHWTTYGAYLAYREYAKSRGLMPVEMWVLRQYQKTKDGFLGTGYSKAKSFAPAADTLTWYDFPTASVIIDGGSYPSMYDATKLSQRDKYALFLYGNNGLTVIRRQGEDDARGEPRRVLVIKDSYGNCLVPFLTWNYDEVYTVDLRSYTGSLSELTAQTAFEDVLILYSFSNFQSDRNLARLAF